jgi:branched-chain amino acid transport system substrate-binding protein
VVSKTLLSTVGFMTKLWIIGIGAVIAGAIAIYIASDRQAVKSIRIGYAISLSGPNSPGARVTVLPNYRLWVREVNATGGIMLSSIGKRVPIEVVEYDDESRAEKALEAVERLIKQDRVDFIFPPWGTGLNLAVGPLLHRAGYPHLAVTAMSDRTPELAQLWPNSFWFLAPPTDNAQALVSTLARLRSEGKIGGKVAMVSVANQFGIGLAKAARRALEMGAFKIVYDRAYAVGQEDMREMIAEAKKLSPDSFLAFSYPADTTAITEQARASNFNPKLFYTAVGTAFPLYKQHFGGDIEGVLGTGGWTPNTPESKAFLQRHLEAFGQEADRWVSPITYASLQLLQQAVERVGKIDREAIIAELRDGTFQTILGRVKLEKNMYTAAWAVGQWQNGEYYGIAPATLSGAKQILFPKPAWRAAP